MEYPKIAVHTVAFSTSGRRRVLALKASVAPSTELEWSLSKRAHSSKYEIYDRAEYTSIMTNNNNKIINSDQISKCISNYDSNIKITLYFVTHAWYIGEILLSHTCPFRMEVSFNFCLSNTSLILLSMTECRSSEIVTHAFHKCVWHNKII